MRCYVVSKCQSQSVKLWKMMLEVKKFEKSLAVSFLFLTFARHLQVAQLAWASEPIVFGSAFVSIYGKAFISLCF